MRGLLLAGTVALAAGGVVQMDRIDSADLTYEMLVDYMQRDVPFVVENKHATGNGPNAWRSTKYPPRARERRGRGEGGRERIDLRSCGRWG